MVCRQWSLPLMLLMVCALCGISFTSHAMKITLREGEWLARPHLILLRDRQGLQFWGQNHTVCFPRFELETRDPYGAWVVISEPRASRVSQTPEPLAFQITDHSCGFQLESGLRFELRHLTEIPEKPPDGIEKDEFKKRVELIPRDGTVLEQKPTRLAEWTPTEKFYPYGMTLNGKKFYAVFSARDMEVRTATIEVPFVGAKRIGPRVSLQELMEGKLASSLPVEDFLTDAEGHLQRFPGTFFIRFHPDLKTKTDLKEMEKKIVQKIRELRPSLEEAPVVYVSEALSPGQWQGLLSFTELDPPKQNKKRWQDAGNPETTSAHARETFSRLRKAGLEHQKPWFLEYEFHLDGQEVVWLEQILSLYRPKSASTTVDILLADGPDDYRLKQRLWLEWNGSKQKSTEHRIQLVLLKKGLNSWRKHRIIVLPSENAR